MRNSLELQLRKLALLLTVAVVLLLVWSAARLLLLAEPEPILPAEASLRVDRLSFESGEEELAQSLAARPLFWQNRQPYVPPVDTGKEIAPVVSEPDNSIDGVVLQGVYTGENPGIIISYNGERRRLSPRDSIGSWEFTMMSPDSAIFENGSDSRTLSLEHALPEARTKKRIRGKKKPEPETESKKDNRKKTGE